jgi:hypothetical protein
MKVIRVSDEAYKFFTEWAKKEGRSVCKQMDIAAKYSEQYVINRKKEDYIKSVAVDTFYEMDLWNQKKKMEREINKALRAKAKEKTEAVEETQEPHKNPYKPDTYEWYMEEGLTRELNNDEVLRVNELSLIKEGWDPVAAHKKIYC